MAGSRNDDRLDPSWPGDRGPQGFTAYRRILRLPGAVGFFVPAIVARLGVAATGIGMLFSVHGFTGSYAFAGAVTGVFATAEAIAGPQVGRLIDRFGQGRILPAVAGAHLMAIVLTMFAAASGSLALSVPAAVFAGATVAQPGALAGARWVHILPERSDLRVAFSLEAAVNDAVFIIGPPVVTVLSGLVAPWAGSAVAAVLLVVGCLVLAAQTATAPSPAARSPRSEIRPHSRTNGLRSPAFLAAVGVNLGLGCFFGAAPILVTATATGNGIPAIAGFVLAATSVASLVSGLVYGASASRLRPQAVQLTAAAVLLSALVLAVFWPSLLGLAVAVLIGGIAIAPLVATSSQIVEASIERRVLTQGLTWINTASAAGVGISSAAVGFAIEAGGLVPATVVAMGLVGVAVASALAGFRGPR
ncbi:MFS transporter [Microbacterium pygmaeum]|uniref:Predicted arabinose efflux permease, MFS family n=1 Tax=Microbacterium pygmaeum TaxID=370764 RepID=A0A1G7TX96_9MICO|nr:MFS transporter [Microbacterium pygmaeum]SDG39853.1 Predicted arabinose efflux permease, MFS family [Microbacterium pygmaeum]